MNMAPHGEQLWDAALDHQIDWPPYLEKRPIVRPLYPFVGKGLREKSRNPL